MINKDFLSNLDIDYFSIKHNIAKKFVYHYQDRDLESRDAIDELYTAYRTLKLVLEHLDKQMFEEHFQKHNFSIIKLAAITKITKSLNELFSELIVTVIMSDVSTTTSQVLRQIIEYFAIMYIISTKPAETAVLYMNQNHVLEYNSIKQLPDQYIGNDLKEAYKKCIVLFSKHHGIDYAEAEKIYKKPYGWAYKIFDTNDDEPFHQFTSKIIREKAFKQIFKNDSMDNLNILVKTLDMLVHPTPTYLHYSNEFEDEEKPFKLNNYNTSIRLLTKALEIFKLHINNTRTSKVIEFYVKTINKFAYNEIYRYIEIKGTPYDIEVSYKKLKPTTINDEQVMSIIDEIGNHENNKILFINAIHYYYFNHSKTKQLAYSEFDAIFAIMDTLYINISEYWIKNIEFNYKLLNITHFMWAIVHLLRQFCLYYAFGYLVLSQKTFRMFMEYAAFLYELIESDDKTNKHFFDVGYLLAKDSVLKELIDKNEWEEKLLEFKSDLGIQSSDFKPDFTSWTLSQVHPNGIKSHEIVNKLLNDINDNHNFSQAIWNELKAVIHAGLYADEINNDFITNENYILSYLQLVYMIIANILTKWEKYSDLIGNRDVIKTLKEVKTNIIVRMMQFYDTQK